ncbi:inorganic diphosphatase [Pedobacter gandavensis]|uniref:inorganic diphosphatase n=1 Tax=Pedobacter gandavensis TaxID=2679963 RepID=UPI00247ACF39|nr:inorganic diphosphatase [Pedobacter gandavensis]WGQ10697.1 inorganic diphosphatase [Pedobacter gandavensis]
MEAVTVIIETPKGSGQKYDYDPKSGKMKLKKVMPLGLVFPFDFGFIPGTVGGDGDPLDVLVVSEVSAFSGCVMDCRIIGAFKVIQQERDGERMRNDRLIAVPEVSQRYADVNSLRDLSKTIVEQAIAFFTSYNEQAGKKFNVLEKLSAAKAFQLIEKGRLDLPLDWLVEIFLPLYDDNGRVFPETSYAELRKELTAKFGGLTEYSRNMAKGFWKPKEGKVERDELLVFEVMCAELDPDFWERLKLRLLKIFKQDSLIIRCSKIELQ